MCVYLSIYMYAIDAKQNLTAFHVNYGIKQVQALSWLLFGALTLIRENKLMTVAVASSWLSDLTSREMLVYETVFLSTWKWW